MADDLADLQRRIIELERRVELDASVRKLSSSAIGPGNLRIHDGGSITIDAGGDAEIVTGNLILGEGTISGDALATQFDAAFFHDQQTITGSTEWTTGASLRVSLPDWASIATLTVNANAQLKAPANLRVGIGTGRTMPVMATENRAGYDDGFSASVLRSSSATAATTVTAQMQEIGQGWPTNTSGNVLDLSVTAIYFR